MSTENDSTGVGSVSPPSAPSGAVGNAGPTSARMQRQQVRFTGFLKLRRGLFDHLYEGRITPAECMAFIFICAQAAPESGIWFGSAKALSVCCDLSPRYARDVMESLESKGYIKRFATQGKRGNYPILCNRFQPSTGRHEGKSLNALSTEDWRQPVYDSCEVSGNVGVNVSSPIREVRSKNREERLSSEAPSILADAKKFAYDSFTSKLGQPPTWDKADYVQCAKLIAAKPSMPLAEFQSRWLYYLDSTNEFIASQGGSLKWFCTNFDRFIMGAHHNGTHQPNKAEQRSAANKRALDSVLGGSKPVLAFGRRALPSGTDS